MSQSIIKVGISACLLGREVRFDGGHKRNAFLVDQLGSFVEWVPVCPEVETGMGTPREALHLLSTGDTVRMVGTRSGRDWSDEMRGYAAGKMRELAELQLAGFVLKKNSPSCGLHRVKLYGPRGGVSPSGRGLFAQALITHFPLLPVEEEGRLEDPVLRDNFVECVFAYARLQNLFQSHWKVGDLVRFHTAEKLTLLAHVPQAYTRLGRLVARARSVPRAILRSQYSNDFMRSLKVPATRRRHRNVLQHIAGYFKRGLDSDAKAEVASLISRYAAGKVPLVVPLTLIRHHIRRLRVEYLKGQTYLEPHPAELMLRNSV